MNTIYNSGCQYVIHSLLNAQKILLSSICQILLISLIFTIQIKAQEHVSLTAGIKVEVAILFDKRENKENLLKSIELIEQLLKEKDDRDLLSLLSRSYYLMAEYEDNKTEKLKYYDKGLKSGERALMTIETYSKIMEKGRQREEQEAIAKLDMTHIDALYWTAANVARYAKYAPFRQKLVLRSRISNLWERIFEMDPEYFYAGAYRFYGGYYALVPAITGDQDIGKSKEMFEKAIEIAPEYLETKVLYAEAYATHAQINNPELFRNLLQEVIAFDLESYPDLKAENKIAQNKARILLKQETELFGD